jgi:hypothetical protein
MDPILVEIGKFTLVAFIAVGVLVLVGTYLRRRRSGIRPWRPPNSRIIGYDAPIPQIQQPPGPPWTDGQVLPPDSPEPDDVRRGRGGGSSR